MKRPFADPMDVAAVLQIDEADLPTTATELLLELASGVIAEDFPRVVAETSVPSKVRTVCAQMVARVVRNPGGAEQEQIGSYSASFPAGDMEGALYITKTERQMLAAWKPKAGTIKVTSPYAR